MSTRAQNEKKFGAWDELLGGGRRYWLDVTGRMGWRARYLKEVNAGDATSRFTEVPGATAGFLEFPGTGLAHN